MSRAVARPWRVLAACLAAGALGACGGGAGTGGVAPPTNPLPTGANVAPLLIDAGILAVDVNVPSVSVTICAPGTATCQTIDHILVDTGSTGLRIMAAALGTLKASSLPQVGGSANPTWECLVFADGYSWGSLRTADVKIANGSAAKQQIQLIGDPAITVAPLDCAAGGAPENTPGSFAANGVLGVSPLQYDCDSACETIANPGGLGFYYACPGGACTGITMPKASQVQNVVPALSGGNGDGIAIMVPQIPDEGSTTITGALVLGIDTQSNNQLGSATVLAVDPVFGEFRTTYKGTVLPGGFIDSGSNGLFFPDATLTQCKTMTGFYCPSSTVSLTATNSAFGGSATSTVSFKVGNAELLTTTHGSYAAFNNLGGPDPATSSSFDFGMPFFYGRTVFVGFEGQTSSAGAGPYFAY
jgi:hypothetical protein